MAVVDTSTDIVGDVNMSVRVNEVDPSTDAAGDVGVSAPVKVDISANGVDDVDVDVDVSVVMGATSGLLGSDVVATESVVLVTEVTDDAEDAEVDMEPTEVVGEVPQRLFPPLTTHPASLHASTRTGTSPTALHSYRSKACSPHSEEKVDPHTYQV